MQGYLTLATGDQLYFDAAINLALSVRLNDPTRPLSVLCDSAAKLPPQYRDLFDKVIELPPHSAYSGCGDKLRMPLYSPYEETIFIDADCFIAKPDMDRHWKKLSGKFWGMYGIQSTDGAWYGKPIERMMLAESVPYIVQMNSGVFFFRQGNQLERMVQEAREIAETDGSEVKIGHRGVSGQLADEPIWGVLMARHRIDPVDYTPAEGIVSVSTYQAKHVKIDIFTGLSFVKKSVGFHMFGRFLSKGWVQHSPSVPHFVAFEPRRKYAAIANRLRQHYELPPFSFKK